MSLKCFSVAGEESLFLFKSKNQKSDPLELRPQDENQRLILLVILQLAKNPLFLPNFSLDA